MKPAIHPTYNSECKVTCACGNSFTTGSTFDKIDVDICSKCHPAYTGVHKFVDIKGKIDKFKDKQVKSANFKAEKAAKTAKDAKRQAKA